jgi:hypothetical protein
VLLAALLISSLVLPLTRGPQSTPLPSEAAAPANWGSTGDESVAALIAPAPVRSAPRAQRSQPLWSALLVAAALLVQLWLPAVRTPLTGARSARIASLGRRGRAVLFAYLN